MKIYRGLSDPRLKRRGRCLAVGIFDGVHRGHMAILKKALRAARASRLGSLVVTFEPHPQKVLSGKKSALKVLMSLEHRLRLFSSLGLREALVIRFNKKFSRLTHEDFLRLLIEKTGMRALSVGDDFRFGRFAKGDRDYLKQASRKLGFRLFLTRPLKFRGRVISSTRIRRLIEGGDLAQAARLLGRPVSLYGTVVHGHGRGRSLGFPTANLDPHHETLPPEGVYAVHGRVNGSRSAVDGVLHIGKKPTFADAEKSVEAHLFGRKGDLYGRELELFFVRRLRGIRRFRNGRELARAIERDTQRARRILA